MPMLDIEKRIKDEKVKSRFKLVRLASIRAKQLNRMKDDDIPLKLERYHKVTTNALDEIIEKAVDFEETDG
ncbi:MAG: DNA-directed RNA polymerase subunit omega [Geovibrio sp.]|uniref:DNA-directed RNA polymerase subunit omega n=1 Tax=Geovibrio ferrireducens TaxID=46201 RepID=UPI0022475233|nr:DNA-directed RNA polymerase subunit omega [Geovibrio ferrireducens]MCD8491206.1 DNA-directed RNA polymerase subunit omega [Geovibrio sp.]MCD8567236.1 DNA-directed RNA polymerase subunit omega [Geovibrio sp.]